MSDNPNGRRNLSPREKEILRRYTDWLLQSADSDEEGSQPAPPEDLEGLHTAVIVEFAKDRTIH